MRTLLVCLVLPGVAACDERRGGPTPGPRIDAATVPPVSGDAGTAGRARCDGAPVPSLRLEEAATGLSAPVSVAFEPRSAARLYAVEKHGVVRLVAGSSTAIFLDIADRVASTDERGLLSLAFHPRFGTSGERRFFVYYTQTNGDSVIASYRASAADPDRAEPEETRLLEVRQPAPNHNGGALAFGPDGYLYFGFGDGGGRDDGFGHAQDVSTVLGSMVRLDPDRHPEPPSGNLAVEGANPYTYHYGLRNPFRFSFDRATGDLYLGDVGQDAWEEVNVLNAGAGPRNFGWPLMEGRHCYLRPSCNPGDFVLPVDEYATGDQASVIGGYVYRGRAIPGLAGRYLYADYYSGRIFSFKWDGQRLCEKAELTDDLDPGGALGDIAAFGEDSTGEVYVVSMGAGTVFRIVRE